MTEETKSEAAPFSVEEMRSFLDSLEATTVSDYDRVIATAAGLERATNWILAHERDEGKGPIPALKTVAEAFRGPADHYDGNACMDACRLACRGRDGLEAHLVASAIQYLWRSGRKGPALPDLLKARDMVDRLVRELGGGK